MIPPPFNLRRRKRRRKISGNRPAGDPTAPKFKDHKPMTTAQRLLWIKQFALTPELKTRIMIEVMSAENNEEQMSILKKYAASL